MSWYLILAAAGICIALLLFCLFLQSVRTLQLYLPDSEDDNSSAFWAPLWNIAKESAMDNNKQPVGKTVSLPSYTLGEELLNSISHGIGAVFGIAALVLCILQSVRSGTDVAWKVISSCIFCTTFILLYLMSCLYHALKRNRAKRIFRIIDHCTIFLLIAGSYTPYTLTALRPAYPLMAWSVFGIIWAAAAAGITLNAISLKKYARISVACYLLMGWLILLAYGKMCTVIPGTGIALLVWGGIAYSLGAILYAIGSKKRYFHSVFHVFCLIGSVLHFLSIYRYVLI